MSNIIRLPGLIDIHVHLRDPGQTYKEDFLSGTTAALAGGVTAVFDMPNNLLPILTDERLKEKIAIAQSRAVSDFGFYFGTDGKNTGEFAKVADKVVGLKIYLNTTTGNLKIASIKDLEQIFSAWPREKIIVIHAEEDKVDLSISLCRKFGNRIHITHLSHKEALEKVIDAKEEGLPVTCDVAPHYLILTAEDTMSLKSLATVNPSLGNASDREFLWKNLALIDCIASDHAPHSLKEKLGNNPPSGLPGLETMLPLLLTAVKEKRITIEDIIRLTNTNPQKIFGKRQDENTYNEVDLDEKYKIENNSLKTKCGWSPFDGWEVYGKVKRVFIRGTKVYEEGKILASPGSGKLITN